MDSLDEIPETHPIVARLSRRGVIANFDEREALLAQRQTEFGTAPDGNVQVTICPTLACNFERPAYRAEPDRFVMAMHARMRGRRAAEPMD